jgi:hypothetical protein
VDRSSIPADGVNQANITIVLRDSNNNVVGGKTINLNASGGSSSVQDPGGWHGFPGSASSDAGGTSIMSVRDSTAETVTYTAVDTTDNVTLSQTVTMTYTIAGTATPAVTSTPNPNTPHDSRYFGQTGYRVDFDSFWNYFGARGGLSTFGYPTSRTFQFMGFQTQFFQRQVVQLDQNGNPRLLNLLDQGLFPYTAVNGSTFPAPNPAVQAGAPSPSSPTYLADMFRYVQQNAPNTFNGQNVNFFNTFNNTVSMAAAFPNGGGDPGILPGFDLEVWGAPTSQPAVDPANNNFIYVRFQRGIMMYNASTGLTQPVLLADYFKAVLMGANLPPDLLAQAQSSPLYGQYNNTQANGVKNPAALPNTNMQFAFDPA